MRPIDADKLKEHIDKLPALPDGNFAGNHSALKALINMQPTIEQLTNCSEFPNNSDTISRQDAIDVLKKATDDVGILDSEDVKMILSNLPSVQPETAKRIVGKSRDGMTLWYQCDTCKEPVDAQDNYCRGCGRKLIYD